jgi:hypothetical protein
MAHTNALLRVIALAAILIGINRNATAQIYVSFDADPDATIPYHIDSSGRIVGVVFHQDQTYGGFVRNTDGTVVLVIILAPSERTGSTSPARAKSPAAIWIPATWSTASLGLFRDPTPASM